jgi:hypothetical protein
LLYLLYQCHLGHTKKNDARIHSLLHPFQMGGIQKRSTLDAAACLMHKVTTARDEGLFTTALAVNISQFFPSLRHDVLVETLMFQGFPEEVVHSIEAWLQAHSTIYALGAARSQSYSLDSGVPQGDPLSPLLSALYIAPVLFTLFPASLDEALACIFYVDDGVLLHSSTSMRFNMVLLQQKFRLLTDAFLKIGLVLEPAKTELMHFAPYLLDRLGKPIYNGAYPAMDLGVAPFTGDTLLRPSLVWRYLGFFFDPKLSFSAHVDFYVNKALSTLKALRMLGNSVKGLDSRNRALVYKVAAFPILTGHSFTRSRLFPFSLMACLSIGAIRARVSLLC